MRDTGSIVVGWLGKLVVALGLVGVLIFDGFAVVVANFNAADHATLAAREAADTLARNRSDIQAAYDSAVKAVDSKDVVETETFSVDDQGAVHLYVKREAKTLWMHRIGPLKKYTQARQSATGKPIV